MGISWSAATDDFAISGDSKATPTSHDSTGSVCCGYGADGKTKLGYDCAMIPGGVTTANSPASNYEEFCGGKLDKTIRTTSLPFMIIFNSDNFETIDTGAENAKGFKIT